MEFGVAEGAWHDAILLDREKDAAEKPMLAEVQIVKTPDVWALAAIEQVSRACVFYCPLEHQRVAICHLASLIASFASERGPF
ncbi:hypothetical protein HYPDE_34673 [Hyphomicrobium denitrificans 1NES1]|uniref:Uncharacterized protein n=1 Tax=Hyphomicrobium denitrificans 1NES1 TaxID=670307 RepID=N0BDP5_9HYPH|nr:hypothetical protein HYPDE_34673 [Hyphomicrobium denitrificans 1NES1]